MAAAAGGAPPGGAGSDRVVPAIYGLFFAALLLSCSPGLDSKFALPKVLVLGAGALGLCLLWLVRARGAGSASSQPTLTLLALALGAWWAWSTPFAVHVPTALFGEYDYYNGLFTHLAWLLLFVVSMSLPLDARTVRRLVMLLVAAIALVAIVNLAEAGGLTSMGLGEVSTLGDRVAAAALMNFAIPFVVVALLRSRHGGIKCLLAALLALLLVSEFVSQGRGPWVGLLVALCILLAGLIGARFRWQAAALLLAAMALLAGLAALVSPAIAQRFASLTRLAGDESINQRFIYYRAAIRAIGEHPIVGIGFENFRNIYPAYRGPDDVYFFRNIIPTMVHNGYIETALNNGMAALLLYVALIGVVLFRLGRQIRLAQDPARRDLLLCLLAAICAYLVQDLSGWLDQALASVFWVTLGLAANQSGAAPATGARPVHHGLALAFVGVMALASVYMLRDGYARVRADASLFKAQALDARTQWREVESLIDDALSNLPSDSRTEGVAARLYANRFLMTHDPALYARSHALFEASYGHNRFDRMRLINMTALEIEAIKSGVIGAGSALAVQALDKLSQTDGDNPDFHEFKASFFAVQDQFDKALAAIGEAVKRDPKNDHYRELEAQYRAKNLSPKIAPRLPAS